MKINANLFISRDGSLRVTKKYTGANPSELGVQLVIDVPDVFFQRPMPQVQLSIPKEYLVDPGAEITAKWAAQDISGALGLEVKAVEDGLLELMKQKTAELPGD